MMSPESDNRCIGLEVLPLLKGEISRLEQVLGRYRERLGAAPGLRLMPMVDGVESSHQYCTIRIDAAAFGRSRDEVQQDLKAYNVFARKYFYPLCSDYESYRDLPSASPDCLPVALIGGGQAAMLHCGWRPLAAGIVEKALASFEEPPPAAIGPGIGRCCYEVGEEVLSEFADLEGVADGRMLDLRMVVRRKLEAGGVTQIEDVDLCTSCRPDLFFSHRRDDGVTGRQGGFAWLS